MLSVKKRQTYLKELGFYTGKIDGKEGNYTRAAYLALQKKYFKRAKDHDGKYGKDTDILLQSAYNCRDLKYFKLEEFKCKCGGKYCTGYPAVVNRNLALMLDNVLRPKYGSMTITSGLRCNTQNARAGGVSNSCHKTGKAVDFQCAKSRKGASDRTEIINFCKKQFKYSYGNTSGMGASVHVNV